MTSTPVRYGTNESGIRNSAPTSFFLNNGMHAGEVRHEVPKDKRTRINIYLVSPFILVGLIFLGVNLYKNLHYSTFTLTASKDYQLSQSASGFIITRSSITKYGNILNSRTSFSVTHPFRSQGKEGFYKTLLVYVGLLLGC